MLFLVSNYVLICQNISVPGFTVNHIQNCLVGLLHWACLNPDLDSFGGHKVKHFSDFPRTANN